jgi:DNA (cytosine-5)-methyltransferase 1
MSMTRVAIDRNVTPADTALVGVDGTGEEYVYVYHDPAVAFRSTPEPAFRVVDFFCGCGGTSAGLRASGGLVILGLDNDRDASQTFRDNFPEAAFIEGDIRGVPTVEVRERIAATGTRPLLFCGCAPCQPFSRQNGQRYTKADDRADLLDHFCDFVLECDPEFVLIENVAGIQDLGPESPIHRAERLLRRHGYSVRLGALDAQDYGVPQRRKRVFLLASKSAIGRPELPPATHGKGRSNPSLPTVGEAIGHLPPLEAGECHPTISNHSAARLSPTNLKRIKSIPVGGSRRDLPQELLLDCHKRDDPVFTDVYGRLRYDKPASAMTTRCVSLSNGRFGHPTQDRAISGREAAALQTFSEDFVFSGALTSIARQVGNAVPVKLAAAMGAVFADLSRRTDHHA